MKSKYTSHSTGQPLPGSGKMDPTSPPVNKVPVSYGQPVTKLAIGVDSSGTVTFAFHGETHPFENTLEVALTGGDGLGKYDVRVNGEIVAKAMEDMGREGHARTEKVTQLVHTPSKKVEDLLDVASILRSITVTQALELISCLTNGLKYLDSDPDLDQCRQTFNTKGYGPNPSGCVITRS